MVSRSPGLFVIDIPLTEGVFEYKFVVDDEWHHDTDKQSIANAFGSVNNILQVER